MFFVVVADISNDSNHADDGDMTELIKRLAFVLRVNNNIDGSWNTASGLELVCNERYTVVRVHAGAVATWDSLILFR